MVFQLIFVINLLIFYGCYFLKMLRQKKQGIQTSQIGKGKVGFVKFVEVTMGISAILVFLAELVSVFLDTGPNIPAVRFLGAGLSTAGTAVFIAAVRTMGESWRAGVPETDQTKLITSGIYRFSRNPAFLGFDLLYLGGLLMFFNPALCILTVFAVLMYHLQIVNVEEDFLLATFGDAYLQYRKKVFRYLGRKR